MAGSQTTRGRRHLLARLLLPVLLLSPLCAAPALAGERRPVPSVLRYSRKDAIQHLHRAGFKVGEVYEVSRQRLLELFRVPWPAGYVWMQNPDPAGGKLWDTDRPVDLIVSADRDGKLPRAILVALYKAAGREPPEATRQAPQAPQAVQPPQPEAPKAMPPLQPEIPAADGVPPPAAPAASDPGAEEPAPPPGAGEHPLAIGSPDAPRAAPEPDPDHVPELVGLDLVAAEELVRDAKMKLYVERVAGHPIGRVLKQIPRAGASRPAGGVVKVTVTAGGDFEGEMPTAPKVYVAEITVPDILDRTRPQAERIAEDLGLTIQIEKAKRGLPGRVVDQMPAGGGRLARGGVLRVWIGPGEDPNAPGAKEAPGLGPLPGGENPAPPADAPKGASGAGTKADAGEGGPQAPLPPGPLPGGVPQPVAPGVNTEIPHGATVPVGFTWKGVQGATAYILEVEEQGAEGRWMPLSRKPARTTAVLLDVERLDPKGASRLRWRVIAVISGRPGTPSRWVPLR